jgi:hypothetical protein
MRSIRRALAATVGVLTLTAIAAVVAVPAASAKDGPLSVQSVWVGDASQNQVTVLNSGSTATYHMDVDNTTGAAMLVDIEFEVFSSDWASNYSYYYTADNINMAPGLSRFYSPNAILLDAYTGDYIARISIWPANSANPSNDGDWGEAYFHIFSLSVNPVDDVIPTLQNAALCAGDIVGLVSGDDILLTAVQTGVSAIGYFEDTATGNEYTATVDLIPGVDCVSFVTGAFQVYHVVQT